MIKIEPDFNKNNCTMFRDKNGKGLSSNGECKFKVYVDYDCVGVFDDFDTFTEKVEMVEWQTKGLHQTQQMKLLEEFWEFWHNNYNKK